MKQPFLLTDLTESRANSSGSSLAYQVDRRPSEPSDRGFPFASFVVDGSGHGGAAPAEIEPRHSADDLANAVTEAKRATAIEVEAQTRAAIATEIGHRQSQALEAIRDQLCNYNKAVEDWMAEAVVISQRLAVMLAQAVVPKALEQQPLADIGDMVRQTITRLVDLPSIELRMAPDLVGSSAELLDQIANEAGFRGELKAVADPSLADGEARLSWQGGAAERDLTRLQAEVSALVDTWLPAEPSASSDLHVSQSVPAAHEPQMTSRPSSETGHPSAFEGFVP